MINQDIKDSKAYKTYYNFAIRKATSKEARKYKKVSSSLRKLSHVLEEEPIEKPKRKKTPAKVDRGKSMDLLSDATLLKATQLKKILKKSKMETQKLHASGLGDGVGSQPKVLDEQENKTTSTNEGTGIKPGVLDVPKYLSDSENESWGDSGDDDDNKDESEVTKDDVESNADDDKEASDSEKTDSDEDENLNLDQNDDVEEEKRRVCSTPDSFKYNDDHEEYEELYNDVNTKYEKVKNDKHVTLTTVHDTQKTEGPMQSLSVSFDFANQFLNLDNIPPTDTEVISMMNVKVCHEEPSTQTPPLNISVTVIPETSTATVSTIPLTIPPITPL
nr:hypothetical protein [Tanacetum cinerariifolium]